MMEQYIERDGKKLRLGYTTGSCAAAAAKAAAWMLLTGARKETITLDTPKGIHLNLKVKEIRMDSDSVTCAIEKDSGDDPDVTRGMLIFATVTLRSFRACISTAVSALGGSPGVVWISRWATPPSIPFPGR